MANRRERMSMSDTRAPDQSLELHLPSVRMVAKEQELCSPTKILMLPSLGQSPQKCKSSPAACESHRRRKRSSSRIQLQPAQREADGSCAWPHVLSDRSTVESKCPSSAARQPSVSKAAPRACMKVGSRAARHRIALQDSIQPCQHTQSVVQRVILTPEEKQGVRRLVNAEARRRHEQRTSFHERSKVVRVLTTAQGHQITKPSIWQLSQCASILREAVEDIVCATRIVRKAMKHSRMRQIISSKWPQLKAMAALSSCLTRNRAADAQWLEILDSVRTPRGCLK